MRMILGLYAPTSGSVTVNGRATTGIDRSRVEGVIDLVGLRVEAPIGTVIPPR